MKQAVTEAMGMGAEAVLHCGDLVAPSTLRAIWDIDIPIHIIHGNNMGDTFILSQIAQRPDNTIVYHGQDASIELHGRKIFMVHYPHYAIAMATTGDYDLVCNGHEHKARVEWIDNIKGGKTMSVDPGTIAGISGPPTWVLGDLENMEFVIHSVE